MKSKDRLLQNIFCGYADYLNNSKQPLKNIKAIESIRDCRTQAMGVSYFSCKDKHKVIEQPHSCRHRSCYLCAGKSRLKWIESQKARLFNAPHFHVIFTLPHEYLSLWQYNEAWFTQAIFKISSDTLLSLMSSEKFHGVKPGIMMALHTWGRQLNLHPHTHCLVTSGGLNSSGEWQSIDKYLLPIRVVKSYYRSQFQTLIKEAFEQGELTLPPDMDEREFWRLYRVAYKKSWSVRIEDRYEHGKGVMLYLARYLKGGPLNPAQIKHCDNDRIVFNYKDHRDQRVKPLSLKPKELLRRLLQHVPVTGSHMIRYFGLYASSAKAKREQCQALLGNLAQIVTPAGERLADMVLFCQVCG